MLKNLVCFLCLTFISYQSFATDSASLPLKSNQTLQFSSDRSIQELEDYKNVSLDTKYSNETVFFQKDIFIFTSFAILLPIVFLCWYRRYKILTITSIIFTIIILGYNLEKIFSYTIWI